MWMVWEQVNQLAGGKVRERVGGLLEAFLSREGREKRTGLWFHGLKSRWKGAAPEFVVLSLGTSLWVGLLWGLSPSLVVGLVGEKKFS